MTSPGASPPIRRRVGAQLWIERDADRDRVDFLVARAAETGLELLRIFLLWPWIEPEPGVWTFGPFDAVFDAAERHDIGIKATLTANSGPWHIETPSLLHSTTLTLDPGHRPAMRRYLEACVGRYRSRTALEQWIIWNEPLNNVSPPGQPNKNRTDEQRRIWTELLRERYTDINELNKRWRTGYSSFGDVDFAEDVAHPSQRGNVWESYRPWLDDWRLRVQVLHHELSWVKDVVRTLDATTPLCINPPDTLANNASVGYDLSDLADITDVLGASFHAPWQLAFAPRDLHVPLVVAGTTLLRSAARGRPVELTEFQLGNTYYAGRMPLGVDEADISAGYLAPLLGGAASVTGWSMNTRRQDFEAGDWGLLDDADSIGDRARAIRRVTSALAALDDRLGSWEPVAADALVLTSEASQAVQLVTGFAMPSLPGRDENDAIRGSALLAAELLRLGVPTAMAPVTTLAAASDSPRLLVVSHLTAWEAELADELVRRVELGAVLLLDGTSGHKDHDAALHRPWPGHLSERLGFRSTGLHTDPAGFPVAAFGAYVGRLPLAVAEYDFTDPAWSAVAELRLPELGSVPCAWTRPAGNGAVVLVSGALGPALAHDPASRPLARALLSRSYRGVLPVRPITDKTMVLPVRGAADDAVGVFAPAIGARRGQPVRITAPPGGYVDLWSGTDVQVDRNGEVSLLAPEGIALLAGRGLAPDERIHQGRHDRSTQP